MGKIGRRSNRDNEMATKERETNSTNPIFRRSAFVKDIINNKKKKNKVMKLIVASNSSGM